MSEDLDSFFAKRKTKASKKKTAIRLDDVAQTLEQNLKFGLDETESQNADIKREAEFFPNEEEDSEWIQYDSKPQLPLETVGVFNYSEQIEPEDIDEERQQKGEKVKTWEKAESVKEETPTPSIQTPEPPVIKSQPATYKPPNSRGIQQPIVRRPVHKLDIENEEMFPTLGAVVQTVKEEKPQPKPKVNSVPEIPSELPQKAPEAPIPDNKPPEDPIQVPERRFETDNRHYPHRQSGHHDSNRPRHTPAQQGPRGTGIFNARGEEIMENSAPSGQQSWRRDAGNTIRETVRIPSPPSSEQRHQRHHYQAKPAPAEPVIHDWRAESKPIPQRPPKKEHHHPPSRKQEPVNNTPNNWRREDPTPSQPVPATSSPQTEQAVEGDDWQTVSARRGGAKYVPPNRR